VIFASLGEHNNHGGHPVSDKNLRIVVIGAGMAGILAGIKLQESGYRDITIYEKGDRVGGTWRENTYPGLTCDVPSHHYTYTFARNPDWTRHLSPGPEIQAYFVACFEKYGLEKVTRFNVEIEKAEFLEGRWHLELKGGEKDIADVVIAATGVLHQPSSPSIPGTDTFSGALFHSARWDHSVPLAGKRIGVIGMGSTGVQIVSALVDDAARVDHFVRNPQWIMPTVNGHYSAAQRAAFRADPNLLLEEMDIEQYTANVERWTHGLTDRESEGAVFIQQACLDNLEKGIQDPALREQLRPDHDAMCKRLIFSPEYYQAIQKPTACLVRDDIQSIEPCGIRMRDGTLRELDVIVFATGFRADQFMRPMEIVGRNGVDLESCWRVRPEAYLAITMPDFPNFFMLNGPNGPVGNFSLIDIAEHQWAYIDQLLEKLGGDGCREISPTRVAMEEFGTARIAAAKTTIWYTGGCQSWYLDSEGIPASWPWNYSRFVAEMQEPSWDCFELVAASNN
jgi:cation diffusion facilitator CzcD-associated flavoprotein CzcO